MRGTSAWLPWPALECKFPVTEEWWQVPPLYRKLAQKMSGGVFLLAAVLAAVAEPPCRCIARGENVGGHLYSILLAAVLAAKASRPSAYAPCWV